MTGFLSDVFRLSTAKTRSISSENPTGEKSGGAKALPDGNNPASMLGAGWKVRPCITLPAGAKIGLADIAGPGVIRHIWITVDPVAYRNVVFRIYWDHETEPSVEVPLGDFFCSGHGLLTKVNSIPVCVNPKGGLNSFWPMPFREKCRIEVENQWNTDIGAFFYQIDYELDDLPENAAYFHAQWRRSVTPLDCPEHIIVDDIIGKGQYVGTYIAWTQLSNGWWGEGEMKFFMDGDAAHPTICGTGTEDYFLGAWCFYDENRREETFCTPFAGYPMCRHRDNEVPKHGLYRWHILDPIRFQSDLKVTIQALGWWPNKKFQPLQDDLASVAYWYQTEPHTAFPAILPVQLRWPR